MNSHTCIIKCPFFQTETEKKLSCEGCKEGIINIMKFKTSYLKVKHIEENCAKFPNECPNFKAAWKSRS